MRAARRWTAVALIAAASAVGITAVAGGLTGSDAPSRVPVPAKEFTGTVHDRAGVEITINRLTFNGEVFFYGLLGEASVTIPFERVQSVRIEPSDADDHVVLFATLRDGETARILVEDDQPVYGVAAFGNYSVEIEDVRSLEVRPSAQ